MSADNTAASTQSRLSSIFAELQNELKDAAMLAGQAIGSFAWVWPIRGLLYSISSMFETISMSDNCMMNSHCDDKQNLPSYCLSVAPSFLH